MLDAQIIETGDLAESNPATVLGTLFSIAFQGCVRFEHGAASYPIYLTGGAFASAETPLQDVLPAALALSEGRYTLTREVPDGFIEAQPWHELRGAVLRGRSKADLQAFGDALHGAAASLTGGALTPWAKGCTDVDALLATLAAARGQALRLRLRDLVDLWLLAAMGVVEFTPPSAQADVADGAPIDAPVVSMATTPPPVMAPSPASSPVVDAAADLAPNLITGSALSEAKSFFRQGWTGAARLRFEDHLSLYHDDVEAAAFVAWIDAGRELHRDDVRRAVQAAIDLALARRPDADLLTCKGSLLRLDQRYDAAVACFNAALRVTPGHAKARWERDQVRLRLRAPAWPEVSVQDVRVDAAILVQRRMGGQVRVHSFKQTEIRIGSGDNDDVVVSDQVLPQIAKRHCTVTRRDGRYWVRRNASLGEVYVNGAPLPIRKDTQVRASDCVRLGTGDGVPDFEFRVFGVGHLHDRDLADFGGFQ